MNANNIFSNDFIEKLNKFKQETTEYNNSQSFNIRFNEFKNSFEASFVINLHELDNSGMFEMFISKPLYQDVKDEIVKLLEAQGFNEVSPDNIFNINDYYFQNTSDNRTYFCVLKYKKVSHKKFM